MKKILFIPLAIAGMWIFSASLIGADTNSIGADTNSIATDLGGIIARVNEKLVQGKNTEANLATNLAEFDALYARHKGEHSEAVVQILLAKGQLYMQVLHEPDKAIAVLRQIKHDFPDVEINGNTDDLIEGIRRMAAAKQILASLVVGAPFPDFNEKDINGNPLSVTNYPGKVVLIDFWATWCPICIIEQPNMLATYKKYHDQGFEIIGINLDADRQQLDKFLKDQKLPWPQYNDEKNKLALKYCITQLPVTYLLDGRGIIIARNLRGDALEAAVAKALGK